MSHKEYFGTLKVEGKKEAEVVAVNKEMVAEMICHYLSQYIDEGENFSITIKCKEVECGL